MIKSASQQVLEMQRGQDIGVIMASTLAKYKGRRDLVLQTSIDLKISDESVRRWCADMGIDIDDYRKQEVMP